MDYIIVLMETNPEFIEALMKFINPVLFILIPILWFLGNKLKESNRIPDWKIPFYLLLFSLLICLSFILISSGISAMSVWVGIMQGFAVWVVEGQLYQSFKQYKVNRKIDENKV